MRIRASLQGSATPGGKRRRKLFKAGAQYARRTPDNARLSQCLRSRNLIAPVPIVRSPAPGTPTGNGTSAFRSGRRELRHGTGISDSLGDLHDDFIDLDFLKLMGPEPLSSNKPTRANAAGGRRFSQVPLRLHVTSPCL